MCFISSFAVIVLTLVKVLGRYRHFFASLSVNAVQCLAKPEFHKINIHKITKILIKRVVDRSKN